MGRVGGSGLRRVDDRYLQVVSGSVHIGEPGMQTKSALGHPFPRTAKLLQHALFDQIYRCGQRHFSGVMTVFFLLRNPQEGASHGHPGQAVTGPRVGFTVGRVLGPSVERNRIRRRMREAVRLNLPRLTRPVDVVINPKKLVLEAEFPRLVVEVERAFAAIEKKANSCKDGALPRPTSQK